MWYSSYSHLGGKKNKTATYVEKKEERRDKNRTRSHRTISFQASIAANSKLATQPFVAGSTASVQDKPDPE